MSALAIALFVVAAAASLAASIAMLAQPLLSISIVLAVAMLAIAWVDYREYRIPDVLSLPSIPLGLLATGRLVEPMQAIVPLDGLVGTMAGGLAFYAVREIYYRLRGREGLGLGDVKLAAVAGAWTGWFGLPHVVLAASVGALLAVTLAQLLLRARAGSGQTLSLGARIPFGVTLAPAIWLVWFLQRAGLFP